MTDVQNTTYNTTNIYYGDIPTDPSVLSLEDGIKCCGDQSVANAGANEYMKEIMALIKEYINGQEDIPQAVKDELNAAIDDAVSDNTIDTPQEANDAIKSILDMIRESAQKDMEEIQKEMEKADGAGGTGESSGAKDKGSAASNWLVKLAKALGQMAGSHLEKMIKTQEKIADLNNNENMEDSEKAGKMAELQAEMQAHTQMFKLLQEALTTIVKTCGEALSSTARKQ